MTIKADPSLPRIQDHPTEWARLIADLRQLVDEAAAAKASEATPHEAPA
jgi:hypothetical protein